MIISVIFVIMCLGSMSTHKINLNNDSRLKHSTTLNKSDNLSNYLEPKSLKFKPRRRDAEFIGENVETLSALPYFHQGLCNRINDLPSSSQKIIENKIIRVVEKEEIITSKIQRLNHINRDNDFLQKRNYAYLIFVKEPNVKQKPRDLCTILWKRVKTMLPSSQRRIQIILLRLVEDEEKLSDTAEENVENVENENYQTEDDHESDEEYSTNTRQNRKNKVFAKRPLPQSKPDEEYLITPQHKRKHNVFPKRPLPQSEPDEEYLITPQHKRKHNVFPKRPLPQSEPDEEYLTTSPQIKRHKEYTLPQSVSTEKASTEEVEVFVSTEMPQTIEAESTEISSTTTAVYDNAEYSASTKIYKKLSEEPLVENKHERKHDKTITKLMEYEEYMEPNQ